MVASPRAPNSRRKVAKPQATRRPHPGIRAPAATPSDEGQRGHVHLEPFALVGKITELQRRREDMIRARTRLELQAQAVCRRLSAGDKVEAGKLWTAVRKDAGHELRPWLAPYLAAMAPLLAEQKQVEKHLAKAASELPVFEWASRIKGLGDLSLAAIVGSCAAPVGEYKSPGAVWKRMGLAVINGERQRRVTGAAALEHGYQAQRRATMWTIGDCLVKAQIRNLKDENGTKIPGSSYAIGEYGALYLERKAYEVVRNESGANATIAAKIAEDARRKGSKPNKDNLLGKLSPKHLHNRAQRYIEKRLLRELWRAWRRATDDTAPIGGAPAAGIAGPDQ